MRARRDLLLLLGIASYPIAAWAASSDRSSRPRGVGPQFAKYYNDPETFTCISNPSIKIPFSAVNDDYCDCPDGSDEPGTSACSHLSRLSPWTSSDHSAGEGADRTPALPGFYCPNKGHRPAYIAFNRVNDGVCDYDICCDGSDEWARVGGIKCENRCKEIGKEWRKMEEQRQKSLTAALRKKKELVAEAGRLTKEIKDRIADLEVEAAAQENKVRALEADLEKIVREERRKAAQGKGKGKVGALAGLARNRVNELREALATVREQRDESRARVKELEEILSKFKEEYNPNFNDEGVKRAVRRWEDYAARGTAGDYSQDAERDRNLDEIAQADGPNFGIDWEHWENQDEGEASFVLKLLAYLPPSLVEVLEDKFTFLRDLLVSSNILSRGEPDAAGESTAVTKAREALDAEKAQVERTRQSIETHREDLGQEYGAQGVFRPLKDVCIRRDSGEYTYEHCFLSQTKQIPKKGGGTINMGRFEAIKTVQVDDVNEAGEVQTVSKLALVYSSGQRCWNGPARSTTVILECAEENEILKVTEDEKCIYSMVVTSPVACDDTTTTKGSQDEGYKDEL